MSKPSGPTNFDRRGFLKLSAVGVGSLAVFSLFGCSSGASDAEPAKATSSSSKEEWSFTDQNGNDVKVNAPCDRMVVLQHHSLDILCQLGAQERIVGVVDGWRKNLGNYMTDVFPGIESMPTPGGLKEWNVENIASLKPDVVIAASQAPEDAIKQVRDLGIPVVVVSLRGEGKQAEAQNSRLANADAAYTEGCKWAIETLGKLAGASDKASRLWEFCKESRDIVEKAVGKLGDNERPAAAVLAGGIAYGNDKYVGCMLLRAGATNAVAAAGVQGNTDYNAELVASWSPDIIITQDRYDDYTTITTDAQYAALDAVKNGKVVNAPYWTKPWGNPDADSIALGEMWMAHVLYPNLISAAQVKSHADEFYKTFYGIDFTGTVE